MAAGKGGRVGDVVVFSDYVCPYCYLAEAPLGRIRGEGGPPMQYRSYELRPAPFPLLDPDEPWIRTSWQQRIEPLARHFGVEMRMPKVQPRSRKAHEAVKFASEQGSFLSMHEAVFRAHFVEGLDIGRIDVLVDLGVGVDLDASLLKVALDVDKYAEQVELDQAEGHVLGITGVPTLIVQGEAIVGLQSYDVLRAVLSGED